MAKTFQKATLLALLCFSGTSVGASDSPITENPEDLWAGLFFIFIIISLALLLLQRRQIQSRENARQEMENAYHLLERQVNDRTQNLRSSNNELFREIAERKDKEKELKRVRNYLQDIINSMPSILIGVTADGRITHWNHSAEEATNKQEEDVLGKQLLEEFPALPVEQALITEAIQTRSSRNQEGCKIIINHETLFKDITIYPLSEKDSNEAMIRMDDVTLRIMMEKMILQNEKMMSLGELAAGMAHEINNPLGAILQSIQNIERRTRSNMPKNRTTAEELGTSMTTIQQYLDKREIFKFLDNIRDAGERSAKIVNNMLEFSHGSPDHYDVNINELITHCLELAENNFKLKFGTRTRTVRVVKNFKNDLPAVRCSPTEIQQVLLNLFRNTSQAFKSQQDIPNKPTLTISTQSDDSKIIISIKDNGPGIPEELQKQIFQPFFTTKEVGTGTGLGLSISYFIITEHHGGNIQVSSLPGEGAKFTIMLPLNRTDTNPE